MPFQNALDERMFVRPSTGLERDGLASLEKTFDLFQTQRFGLLHGDSYLPAASLFLNTRRITVRLILYWTRRDSQPDGVVAYTVISDLAVGSADP